MNLGIIVPMIVLALWAVLVRSMVLWIPLVSLLLGRGDREATLDWAQHGFIGQFDWGSRWVGELICVDDYCVENGLLFNDGLLSCCNHSSFPDAYWLYLQLFVAAYPFSFLCLFSSYFCYPFFSFLLSQSLPYCAQS